MNKLLFLIPFFFLSCSSKKIEKNAFHKMDWLHGDIKSISLKVYTVTDGKSEFMRAAEEIREDNLTKQYFDTAYSQNQAITYVKTDTSYNKYTDGVLTEYCYHKGNIIYDVRNDKRTGGYFLIGDSAKYSYVSVGKLIEGFQRVDTVTFYDEFQIHHSNRLQHGGGHEPYVTWQIDTLHYLEKDEHGNPLIISIPPNMKFYYTYTYR